MLRLQPQVPSICADTVSLPTQLFITASFFFTLRCELETWPLPRKHAHIHKRETAILRIPALPAKLFSLWAWPNSIVEFCRPQLARQRHQACILPTQFFTAISPRAQRTESVSAVICSEGHFQRLSRSLDHLVALRQPKPRRGCSGAFKRSWRASKISWTSLQMRIHVALFNKERKAIFDDVAMCEGPVTVQSELRIAGLPQHTTSTGRRFCPDYVPFRARPCPLVSWK